MSRYTLSAKGMDCEVRIPGICNFDTETTVFAHLNGAGGGMKHADIHGAYACSSCHDVLDRRVPSQYSALERNVMHYDGMLRTQVKMIEMGILKL